MKRISLTIDGGEAMAYELDDAADANDVMVAMAVTMARYAGHRRGFTIKTVGPRRADLLFNVFVERFCKLFELNRELFLGRHNKRPYPAHRAIFYTVWRNAMREGLVPLSNRFRRDHSSILEAMAAIARLMEFDPQPRAAMAAAMQLLELVMRQFCTENVPVA